MSRRTRRQVENLRDARKLAFAHYEDAVARRRDTVLGTIAVAVLLGGSTLWEYATGGTPWGPHWFLLLIVALGVRGILKSVSLVQATRKDLRSIMALHDDISERLLVALDAAEQSAALELSPGLLESIHDHPSNRQGRRAEDTSHSEE